jgi:hypothetical protein
MPITCDYHTRYGGVAQVAPTKEMADAHRAGKLTWPEHEKHHRVLFADRVVERLLAPRDLAAPPLCAANWDWIDATVAPSRSVCETAGEVLQHGMCLRDCET